MLCLRYHKRYLWIFFCSFLLLMSVALVFDCLAAANVLGGSSAGGAVGAKGGSGASGWQFVLQSPRFINVFVVFVFSAISVVIQHFLSRAVMREGLFRKDFDLWKKKQITATKKSKKNVRRIAKKQGYGFFMFSCMFANIIAFIPVGIVFLLWVLDHLSTLQTTKNLIIEFFIPAVALKYFCWYLNAIFSWMFVFRKTKRLNIMAVAKQTNI